MRGQVSEWGGEMKRRVSFRIYVDLTRKGGRPRRTKRFWRVFVHPTQEAMFKWVEKPGGPGSNFNALCSAPSRRETKKSGCLGELNFYWPYIGPGVIAHECLHATLNTLSILKHTKLVPPRWYPMGHFTQGFEPIDLRLWSWRQERACYMLDGFIYQMKDEFVRRELWNK